MKKYFMLVAMVTIYGALFLNGCSKSELIEVPLEEFKYANLLPDNLTVFGSDDILILDEDDGDYYIFEVENVTSDQYDRYVAECKNKGFQTIRYEDLDSMGGYFGAYTVDGKYWVELFWDVETGKLNVCCNRSQHYEENVKEDEK